MNTDTGASADDVNKQLSRWQKDMNSCEVKKYLEHETVLTLLTPGDYGVSSNGAINFDGVTIPKVMIEKNILNLSGVIFRHFFDAQGTIFESRINFSDAHFLSQVNFKGVTFNQDVDFYRASFDMGVSFYQAEIKGRVNLDTAQCKGKLDFRATKFLGPPPCFMGFAHDAPIEVNKNIFFFSLNSSERKAIDKENNQGKMLPEEIKEQAGQEAEDWRILKQIMSYQQRDDLAEKLFGYELEAKGKKSNGMKILTKLYGWVSGYGFSFRNPLIGLAILTGISIFIQMYFIGDCKEGIPWGKVVFESLRTSFLPFITGGGVACLDQSLAYDVIIAFHRFFALILIFLVGLGARNYFRIRL